jgi:hypothetical protein
MPLTHNILTLVLHHSYRLWSNAFCGVDKWPSKRDIVQILLTNHERDNHFRSKKRLAGTPVSNKPFLNTSLLCLNVPPRQCSVYGRSLRIAKTGPPTAQTSCTSSVSGTMFDMSLYVRVSRYITSKIANVEVFNKAARR